MRTRWRTAAVTLGAIAVLLGAPMAARKLRTFEEDADGAAHLGRLQRGAQQALSGSRSPDEARAHVRVFFVQRADVQRMLVVFDDFF